VVARKGSRAHRLSTIERGRRIVGRRGAACLLDFAGSVERKHTPEDLGRLLPLDPRFEWLEESNTWFWFRPAFAGAPCKTENRLVNRIMKRLWTGRAIGVSEL